MLAISADALGCPQIDAIATLWLDRTPTAKRLSVVHPAG